MNKMTRGAISVSKAMLFVPFQCPDYVKVYVCSDSSVLAPVVPRPNRPGPKTNEMSARVKQGQWSLLGIVLCIQSHSHPYLLV